MSVPESIGQQLRYFFDCGSLEQAARNRQLVSNEKFVWEFEAAGRGARRRPGFSSHSHDISLVIFPHFVFFCNENFIRKTKIISVSIVAAKFSSTYQT